MIEDELSSNFQRLKDEENDRLKLDWNLQPSISKVNYRIHTDAIKENLVPKEITKQHTAVVYASEADLLNIAFFGKTALQWRNEHPGGKGNIRDEATIYVGESNLITLVTV